MDKIILEVKNLDVYYKKHFKEKIVLKDSGFYVKRGEVVILIGPNGSGKSSIFNYILNLEKVRGKGELKFKFDNNLSEINDYQELYPKISYVEQEKNMYRNNVKAYIQDSLSNQYNDYKEEEPRVKEMFKWFNKSELYDKKIKDCSGGEKKIIQLIASFLREKSDLYIFDEPLNNLDFTTAKKIAEKLRKLAKEYNKAVLLVSHCRMFLDIDRAYKIVKDEVKDYSYLQEMKSPPQKCDLEDDQCCLK